MADISSPSYEQFIKELGGRVSSSGTGRATGATEKYNNLLQSLTAQTNALASSQASTPDISQASSSTFDPYSQNAGDFAKLFLDRVFGTTWTKPTTWNSEFKNTSDPLGYGQIVIEPEKARTDAYNLYNQKASLDPWGFGAGVDYQLPDRIEADYAKNKEFYDTVPYYMTKDFGGGLQGVRWQPETTGKTELENLYRLTRQGMQYAARVSPELAGARTGVDEYLPNLYGIDSNYWANTIIPAMNSSPDIVNWSTWPDNGGLMRSQPLGAPKHIYDLSLSDLPAMNQAGYEAARNSYGSQSGGWMERYVAPALGSVLAAVASYFIGPEVLAAIPEMIGGAAAAAGPAAGGAIGGGTAAAGSAGFTGGMASGLANSVGSFSTTAGSLGNTAPWWATAASQAAIPALKGGAMSVGGDGNIGDFVKGMVMAGVPAALIPAAGAYLGSLGNTATQTAAQVGGDTVSSLDIASPSFNANTSGLMPTDYFRNLTETPTSGYFTAANMATETPSYVSSLAPTATSVAQESPKTVAETLTSTATEKASNPGSNFMGQMVAGQAINRGMGLLSGLLGNKQPSVRQQPSASNTSTDNAQTAAEASNTTPEAMISTPMAASTSNPGASSMKRLLEELAGRGASMGSGRTSYDRYARGTA